MKSLKLSVLLLPFLMVSCTEPNDVPLSPLKEMLSFRIESDINTNLAENIDGIICDNYIQLIVPEDVDAQSLVATFEFLGEAVYVGLDVQKSGVTPNNFNEPLTYRVIAEDGSERHYEVVIDKSPLPHFYFELNGNQEDINKDDYMDATLKIDGKGFFENFHGQTGIRGRGNHSWSLPKKPYKLKLKNASPLLGLPEAKTWILLAEYLDGSMLYNSIPFKTAEILEIPYTNHIVPVEISINGNYQGVYAFTEHKEVAPNRIDIGDDGILLELDSYFDEEWKFKSAYFDLPVMIAYPKEEDMTQDKLDEIKADFEVFEALVYDQTFPNNNYLDYFDAQAFVDYMIVYELTLNLEIKHPKSTYINKLAGGKYRMGIIWDFDWAFGYAYGEHYCMYSATQPIFSDDDDTRPGNLFFGRLMSDPAIRTLFKERWNGFRTNGFDEVKENVRYYSSRISESVPFDHDIWGPRNSTGDCEADLQRVINWLDARANYLDEYANGL